MPLEPIKLVLVTLLPGQVILGACSFCGGALAFEPSGDGATRLARCKAVKCERAGEKIT